MSDFISEIAELSSNILDEAIDLRRHLHSHPELSFKEFSTSKFVEEYLHKYGASSIKRVAETGLIAKVKGEKGPGKKIVLRAELDALPITEENTCSYKSNNPGVMHACGHDVHMAMLLSVFRLVQNLKNQIKGEIFFLFQPGEELVPGGASLVLADGILDKINPDAIIAQHVLPELAMGKVGFRPGKYMASSDEIYIDVNGKGGHAALPGSSTDQILIASELISKLKSGVAKYIGDEPVVLGFGKFIADGATNVIPSNVHIEGTLRTFDEKTRKLIHTFLEEECKISGSEDVSVELEIRKGYPVLINDDQLCTRAIELTKKLYGDDKTELMDLRMSSEDFAFYSHHYPSLFYRLGVRKDDQPIRNLHTSGFDIYEPAMEIGISTMTSLALGFLED